MKKITIEIEDDLYLKINKLTTWYNLNNDVKNRNKPKDYTVEEAARGLVIEKMKEYEQFYTIHPLLNDDVNKNANIKNNFKNIAIKKGLTQKAIADQLNIHAPALSAIFNNDSQPRTKIFLQIWILLGCPPIHECVYFEED